MYTEKRTLDFLDGYKELKNKIYRSYTPNDCLHFTDFDAQCPANTTSAVAPQNVLRQNYPWKSFQLLE